MEFNVLGSGFMGKQIAGLFVAFGADVYLWNRRLPSEKEATRQVKLLRRQLAPSCAEGNLILTDNMDELPDAITIETVCEDVDVKKKIFEQISQTITKPYFTNASSLCPSEIGRNVHGLHFFNPITLSLVELYVSDSAEPSVLDPLVDFLNNINFDVIEVGNNRGYIGNYLIFNEISNFFKLYEKYNYSLESLQAVYSKLYPDRNILKLIDLIGIDVVYSVLFNLHEIDETIYVSTVFKRAIDNNILGKKNKTTIASIMAD